MKHYKKRIQKYGLEWNYVPTYSLTKERSSMSPSVKVCERTNVPYFIASAKEIPLRTAVSFFNKMKEAKETGKEGEFDLTNDWMMHIGKQSYISPVKFRYNSNLVSEKEVPELRIYFTELKSLLRKMKELEEKYKSGEKRGKNEDLLRDLNNIFR